MTGRYVRLLLVALASIVVGLVTAVVGANVASAHDARGVCFQGDALFTAGQYPAGSTWQADGGTVHTFSGGFSLTLTGDVEHAVVIVSGDGQTQFNRTLTSDKCRQPSTTTTQPATTTTEAPTTTAAPTTTIPVTTTTSPETTTSAPTSTSTTTAPSTSAPTSTSTPTTSSTATSTSPPSTPSSTLSPSTSSPMPSSVVDMPPSTLNRCEQTSSTNSDGVTASSGCETPSSGGAAPPSSSETSSLPSTGPTDAVPFAAAGLAALLGGSALVFVARRRGVR